MNPARELLRELPSLDRVMGHPRIVSLTDRLSRPYVLRRCRAVLDDLRARIQRGEGVSSDAQLDAVAARTAERVQADETRALTRVVNATGTVLHTNFGRALLAEQAVEAVRRVASEPTTLEFDLERGTRGRREERVEQQLIELTDAEAATVVNNNAAAVLLALETLARGKDVIVSRGELVEIGGSFRIPDICAKSGATLREVGTTNRTHLSDYEQAIGPTTGLLLKVHPSNYRVMGFASSVSLSQLVALGARHEIPVMEDLGSGALIDLARYGLPREPVVADSVAMGPALVSFSGDKLLGGPQAGLLVGRRTWIEAIGRNPLHRAVRCGKLTLAALEATLDLYQRSLDVTHDIPTLAALTRSCDELERAGRALLPALAAALGSGYTLQLEAATAQVGSGALPTDEIPTVVIVVAADRLTAEQIARRFRRASPPIVGRIRDDRFLLDLRTVGCAEDLVPRWRSDAREP